MMTAMATKDPFTGKPKSGEGGGSFEVPSVDVHEARIVAMIDLGSHEESFKGEPAKVRRKVYLAFELDEKMSASTFNHVVGVEYALSFHERANLRKLAEALLNDGVSFGADDEIDFKALVGQPCTVQIKHKKSADGAKSYADVGDVGALSKKARDRVFKPARGPLLWFIGQPMPTWPDWLPRIFGETIPDKIKRSRELAGVPTSNGNGRDEGELPARVEDIPF